MAGEFVKPATVIDRRYSSERNVVTPRIVVSDVPLFDEVLGEVVEELGGLADDVAGVGFRVHHRVGEVEFVLRPRQGDVEQAAFFFEHVLVVGVEDAAVGELAVNEPDEEDGFPFEALGLVDGGEGDFFVVGLGSIAGGFAVDGGHERELLEELEDVGEIAGVFGELFEVGAAGVGVVEGGAEVVVIDAFEHAEDHVGGGGELAVGREFVERVAELLPVFLGLFGDLEFEEEVGPLGRRFRVSGEAGFDPCVPQFRGGAGSDAGEQ